ncbi:hypothetical protein EDB80DRAFT_724424 [Ilyonectria destructans]|nr:hypothetical protein EDB80DRAFT_724424 [Ilyonectria destructans]
MSSMSLARKYNVAFKDHTGKPALMSWRKSVNETRLPFLPSWVFYMVNPDFSYEGFDGCAFSFGLEKGRIRYTGGSFRYEFFFLPGATAEECVAHYRGEMDARGTIWRQIRKVTIAMKNKKQNEGKEGADSSTDDSIEGSSSGDESQDGSTGERLPGLIWQKDDDDCSSINYRSWLFMYPDADVQWGADSDDRQVDLVQFDPIPIEVEEDEILKWDPMEHPVHSERMSARGRAIGWDIEAGVVSWMDDRKNANWEVAANEAMCNAKDLGWESW